VGGLLSAFLVGLAAGASFGPVNIEVTKTALVHRDSPIELAIGALLGDAILLIACLAAVYVSVGLNINAWPYRLASGTFIAAIAIHSIYEGPSRDGGRETSRQRGVALARGFGLSTLSIFGIILWSAVAATISATRSAPIDLAVPTLAVLAGDALWFALWLSVLMKGKRAVPARAIPLVHFGANAFLILFAALTILH